MYHEVTDNPSDSGFQRPAAWRYAHGRGDFRAHLDAVAGGPCVPELVTDLPRGGAGSHVLLTFDDGGRSAEHVADELERRGWRGHFFIVTGLLGQPTFLRASDVRRLHERGHLIGSHSHTHPDIARDVPRAELLEEWRVSRRILEDLLGVPCLAASVPGGDISPLVLRTADETGYSYLFTSEPWLVPRTVGSCTVLGRVCVKRAMSPDTVAALVRFRGWHRVRIERVVKAIARRALAPLYRRYMRQSARLEPRLTARGA